jgi:hypothetical protein
MDMEVNDDHGSPCCTTIGMAMDMVFRALEKDLRRNNDGK